METKSKFCSSRGDEAQIEGSQRLLTSSPTVYSANFPIGRSGFREKAAFSKEIKTAALYREADTSITSGRPATFSGQNKPKSASDIVMSDIKITKLELETVMSGFDLTKSEPDLTKSDIQITKSVSDLIKSKPDFTKSELNIAKSETDIAKSTSDFTKSKANLTKSELNLTMSESDFVRSEPDFIMKIAKNRHLAGKRQKMRQFSSLNADFGKTGVAASRQRAASIIILKNCYGGKSGGGLAQSKTLRVRDDSLKTRSVLECSSPLPLCRVDQDSGATRALPIIRISRSRGDGAHFKLGNLKSEIGNDSETPHVVTCGILKRRKSQRLSCFPAVV
jgi:hypothetical protein